MKPDRTAVKLYSRCAKSLIKYGEPESPDGYATVFGYTLELIPEKNPYIGLSAGDTLPIQLLYESKPLEGALVIAFTSDRPEREQP